MRKQDEVADFSGWALMGLIAGDMVVWLGKAIYRHWLYCLVALLILAVLVIR